MTDVGALMKAAEEAGWLVERGYPSDDASAFVARFRRLDERAQNLLRCNARMNACVRHHIAREMDADDVRKRSLVVDAVSAAATILAASESRELLQSGAGVIVDATFDRSAPLEDVDTPLVLLAGTLDGLRPKDVTFVVPPDDESRWAGALEAMGKRKWWRRIEATDPVPRLTGAAFVVSADEAVLDRCATWVNAIAMTVEPLRPPILRLAV